MKNAWIITLRDWRRPELLLLLMAAASPISFATWQALIDNFAIHRAAFTGQEMGILQSLREVPGFLSFAVVFVLILMREQLLAYVALLLLGVGTAVTGFLPSIMGLYFTTVVMSIGFHYYETVASSLALQWLDKREAPQFLGRVIAVSSAASIVAFVLLWLAFEVGGLAYHWMYMLGGGVTCVITLLAWLAYPEYREKVCQHKRLILRRRYWLYYMLTFLSGARRQIFVVFAGFLLVEKFGYDVADIAALFILNAVVNVFLAPTVGRLISRFGERQALILEYLGLIMVFAAYAFVQTGWIAGALYVVDHIVLRPGHCHQDLFSKDCRSG